MIKVKITKINNQHLDYRNIICRMLIINLKKYAYSMNLNLEFILQFY